MKNHYPYFLQFILLILISTMSYGQSTGPTDAGKAVSEFRSNNFEPWTNDKSFATIEFSKDGSSSSQYLRSSEYKFNIPSQAVILGIELNIKRNPDSPAENNINDEVVRLVKSGQIIGSNKSEGANWRKTTEDTYGDSLDLWNTTWTASDINDPSFGAVLAIENNSKNKIKGYVHQMQITIYYSMPTDDIEFNGTDTYANFGNNFNLSTDFSIELWIYRDNNEVKTETLYSKRDPNGLNGYDLSVTDKKLTFSWDGQQIQSPETIKNKKWHHVAVIFKSATYKLYIDGIEVASKSGNLPSVYTGNALLGKGTSTNGTTNYFSGSMDELRIWNVALSETQIREMMNQEIEKNGDVVRGSVLNLDLTDSLSWKNLQGYYQMNQGTDISVGQLTDNSGSGKVGILINMKSKQLETAPLPYISMSNGNWTDAKTWKNGDAQQLPNALGIDDKTLVDWNIVITQHNVTVTDKNIKVLGLLVDTNRLTIQNSDLNDGQSLEVTKWLNISEGAVLDLVGESQLLQGKGSLVGPGTGVLERDQQGTGSLYNYNYWGSPVASSPNHYNLASILRNSSNPLNPTQPIQWTNGKDANFSTTPITMSSRWIYEYSEGTNGNYSAWKRNGVSENFKAGLGFTMKGSGSGNGTSKQNYTFVGQPNNGTITNTVTASSTINQTFINQTLLGNPYPSAIDSRAFIKDNIPGSKSNPGSTGSIDGSLLFWVQSTTNNSHTLKDYQGGYATLSLTGGTPAVTVPGNIIGGVGDAGALDKIPQWYIPVGQGFFVTASDNSDQISNEVVFKNSHRIFKKESVSESVFLRGEATKKNSLTSTKDNESYEVQRVRLSFKTPETAFRHLLLGFTPDNDATDGFDYGYDALNNDDFPSDMSFVIEGKKYIIQGVGAFDINKKYPLDMTLKIAGNVELALTDLENFDAVIDIFIHDALEDTYTQINTTAFQMELEAGNYTNRFSLVFRPDSTLSTIDKEFNELNVKFLQNTNEIYIKTPARIEIRQVNLITITGQTVKSWDLTTLNSSQEYKIPVKDLAVGNYIIKVETNTNSYSKKVMVK